jgi:DNA repair exonuclease SbcCD ATPase subunit
MTRYLEIKPGSISETIKRLSDDYQAIFKKELEKTGKGIGSMTPDEKKAFFNKIDKMHNAKNEATEPSKPEDSKTTLVAAPGNKEKVIRIPKEKLADYKAKGYVEAESYIPEAKKVKEEELTAAQKKLPPALQKAIDKKEKNEEVKMKDDPCWKDYKMVGMKKKNGKDVPNCVPKEEVEIKEGGMKEIDTNKKELERLSTRLSQLRDRKNANAGGDTTDVEKQIKQTQMSVIDLKKKLSATKTEEVEIAEAEGSSGGGMDALRAIKAKRQRLQQELDALNKDDPNYKEKSAQKKKEIEAQREIMARKQREVFDSYDPSLEELEELENVEEAAGPDRLTNLNDKISKLQVNLSKLDKSKPESKTKEAIIKSDLVTAKLRLQDLMQKRNTETKKESVNEAKKNYKSMKKSLKKEQDKEVNTKRTLTDKPITKIDVDPKVKG